MSHELVLQKTFEYHGWDHIAKVKVLYLLCAHEPKHIPWSKITERLHQSIAAVPVNLNPTYRKRTHKITKRGIILVILSYATPIIKP